MTVEHHHSALPTYRHDIDGLRGIAVAAVVLFHAFPGFLPGGFVGVDVFFVISGYLITSIIRSGLIEANFSFRDFYERRARRILPALLVILVCTFSVSWLVLLPVEQAQLARHVFAGAGFFSNFLLASEAGYFDSSADLKPLLHLWSLSIEEQFYLLWPLIAWAAWRTRVPLVLVIALLGGGSFAWGIALVDVSPGRAFYWPQSRGWELLAGCLVACIPRTHSSSALGAIGACLIAASIAFIEPGQNFPGTLALMPVMGTALVILAGPCAHVNSRVLSRRWLKWLGHISFPLYLWHWPLLSITTIAYASHPPVIARIGLVIIAVLLAWLTYRYIERPIRTSRPHWHVPSAMIASLAAIAGMGFSVHINGSTVQSQDGADAFLAYFENSLPEWRLVNRLKLLEAYKTECDFYDLEAYRFGNGHKIPIQDIAPKCNMRNQSKKHVLLVWGDSHAQQFSHGLTMNLPPSWQLMQIASSGCSVQIKDAYETATNYCDKSNSTALETVQRVHPDAVLVGQRFALRADQAAVVERSLKRLGAKHVLFVGPTPQWEIPLPNVIGRHLWPNPPMRSKTRLVQSLAVDNDNLRTTYTAAGLNYVDVMSALCNDLGCLTRIGPDVLHGVTSHDYGHLLPIASDYVAKKKLVEAITARGTH